jgi:hypothetical protein
VCVCVCVCAEKQSWVLDINIRLNNHSIINNVLAVNEHCGCNLTLLCSFLFIELKNWKKLLTTKKLRRAFVLWHQILYKKCFDYILQQWGNCTIKKILVTYLIKISLKNIQVTVCLMSLPDPLEFGNGMFCGCTITILLSGIGSGTFRTLQWMIIAGL